MSDLIRRGVRPGMRVAFPASLTPATLETLIELWSIGAIACPLNPRLPEQAYEGALKRLSPVFAIDREEKASCEIVHNPGELALLLFTSGTSSEPKIAALSHRNLSINAKGANLTLSLSKEDAWRLTLPLYHVSGIGIVIRCLLSGAKIGFGTSHANHLSLIPTQLYRLLNEESPDLFQAKTIVVGGAPLNHTLLVKCLEKNLPIYTTWGMTETSAMATLGKADETGHCGSILPYRELKIDKEGEIYVRGETVFLGYLVNNQLCTTLDKEGWLATGDLGELDAQGRLHWKGRKDHLFISGGENIQPEEIEAALLRLPSIDQAVVISIPDEEWGAVPVAFLSSREKWESKKIGSLLKEQLPSYKVPRHFFPLASDTLKPSRPLLEKEALGYLGLPAKRMEWGSNSM